MSVTLKMLMKVEVMMDRNHRALLSANSKKDDAVVNLCGRHHWRLRRVEEYLNNRLIRS